MADNRQCFPCVIAGLILIMLHHTGGWDCGAEGDEDSAFSSFLCRLNYKTELRFHRVSGGRDALRLRLIWRRAMNVSNWLTERVWSTFCSRACLKSVACLEVKRALFSVTSIQNQNQQLPALIDDKVTDCFCQRIRKTGLNQFVCEITEVVEGKIRIEGEEQRRLTCVCQLRISKEQSCPFSRVGEGATPVTFPRQQTVLQGQRLQREYWVLLVGSLR